jgi:hypothetical protein
LLSKRNLCAWFQPLNLSRDILGSSLCFQNATCTATTWEPTAIKFGKRFERYLDYNFFEHQIHWFSIFNSFMMVIFLTGLVSMILMRTLRNDYAKYAREEDDLDALERDVSEVGLYKGLGFRVN